MGVHQVYSFTTPTRHVAAKVNLRSDAPPSPQGGGFAADLASLSFDGQFLCSLAFSLSFRDDG